MTVASTFRRRSVSSAGKVASSCEASHWAAWELMYRLRCPSSVCGLGFVASTTFGLAISELAANLSRAL